MYSLIKELYCQLTPAQRKRFWLLQVLVVIMALLEVLGIALIGPFMSLLMNLDLITENSFVKSLYGMGNFESKLEFVFYIGLLVLFLLIVSSLISIVTIWKLAIFAATIGTELADRLYIYYANKNWAFHINTTTSDITKKISTESLRVTDLVINPLLQMNAKIISVIFISSFVIAYDAQLAIIGLMIFIVAYLLLFITVRVKLQVNGTELSNVIGDRFKLINECFGGIRHVLLTGRQRYFIEKFVSAGKIYANARGTNHAISIVPRYFMELIAFGSMIGLALYFVKTKPDSIDLITPILAVYALAGFKLLPALQQVYGNLALVKGNISAFESIKDDLKNSLSDINDESRDICLFNGCEIFKGYFELRNVQFSYNKDNQILTDINIKVRSNTKVGIVGYSGSGKSTIADIMLGLLEPSCGEMFVDKKKINSSNIRQWQDIIGYVPQTIFLTEGSITENIAFGVQEHEIDINKVKKAIKLASLEQVIDTLPNGLNTKIGERGVKLSGGQRQRIGIARALYNDPQVIIFDEATSALDGATEAQVVNAVNKLGSYKTIVMIAHRIKTVEKCDCIYFIDSGKVIDKGTYEHLKNNNTFNEMVNYV